MIDQNQIKALDKQYRSIEKAKNKNDAGTPVPRGEHREIQGTVSEKLILPSGGRVIGVSDETETVYVLASNAIYERFETGDRVSISYVHNMLLSVQKHISSRNPEPEQTPQKEEHIVIITIRTWGDACELSNGEIKEWYEDRIEKLFDPNIGGHEVTVKVERKPIE